jgi:hypothetical protein
MRHKPWFDEEWWYLHQRKQAKMQWLQYPNQSNVNNLNNVKHETRRHFRTRKKYLIPKIDELSNNSKIKNIWDFNVGYQPWTKIVKSDLVTDSHSIWLGGETISLNYWIPGVNNIRQAEIHTAETLVPEPNATEVEMAIEKLKRQITKYW